jgi:hypothetical protein
LNSHSRDPIDAQFHMIEDVCDRLEFERLQAMTEEEVLAEVAALEAEEAEESTAAIYVAPAVDAKAPAKVVSLATARAKRERLPLWLLVAAVSVGVAAIGGGGLYVAISNPHEQGPPGPGPGPIPTAPVPSPLQPPPEMREAIKLRNAAKMECASHRWGNCLDDLDEAAKHDPDGDKLPEYVFLREMATDKIAHPDDGTKAPYGYAKPGYGPIRPNKKGP